MLQWSVQALQKHRDRPLPFEEVLVLKANLQEREPDIIDVSEFKVDGQLTVDQRAIIAVVHVIGQLTVPSTRSLLPVELPLDFKFSEIYVDPEDEDLDRFTDADMLFPLEGETLTLQNAIEDHILLHIPSHILTTEEEQENVMPAGEAWAVISEEEFAQKQAEEEYAPNPELAKLKEMLDAKNDDAN